MLQWNFVLYIWIIFPWFGPSPFTTIRLYKCIYHVLVNRTPVECDFRKRNKVQSLRSLPTNNPGKNIETFWKKTKIQKPTCRDKISYFIFQLFFEYSVILSDYSIIPTSIQPRLSPATTKVNAKHSISIPHASVNSSPVECDFRRSISKGSRARVIRRHLCARTQRRHARSS